MMHLFSQNLAHSNIFTFFKQQNVEKCFVFSSRFSAFWYIVLITYFKKLPKNIFCSNLFCFLFMWTPWTHLLLHLFLVFLINRIQSEGNNQGNLFQLAFPSHEFKTVVYFLSRMKNRIKKKLQCFRKKKLYQ